jgi:4-hydroxy-4-methyl-2-oxoglutarate aldolase
MAQTAKVNRLTQAQLEEIRQFSTCVTASAIEGFGVRLYNTGFADSSVHCQFPDLPPVIGYAATARIRSEDPPMEGDGYFYYDRSDLWKHILSIPAPRIVTIQDIDHHPGLGAFVGSVHAHIFRALGCVAFVTNGTVRDITEIRPTGLQLFASDVAVSHAYAHLFDYGGTVRVGGLEIAPGDLVHGDLHGVQSIPLEIADKVTGAAREILNRRKHINDLCDSPNFSLERLQSLIRKEEEELKM